jgi:putative hydrolase of the HAD superfamily
VTIRLLTFDLDDTLWALAPVLAQAEQLAHNWLAEHAGSALGDHTLESLRARRLDWLQRNPAQGHRVSAARLQSVREVLREGGMSEADAAALSQQAFDIFLAARNRVQLFAQAETVLRDLKRRYRIGAITNGNADIERIGIGHLFDFAINAEQLAHAKPHPEPFELALRLGECHPHEAIHVGDHADHDVRAALALGMHAIWVNQTGARWTGDEQPTAQIADIRELPAAVAAIAAAREGGVRGSQIGRLP